MNLCLMVLIGNFSNFLGYKASDHLQATAHEKERPSSQEAQDVAFLSIETSYAKS